MKLLTRDQMAKLTTKRLIGYLGSLRRVHDTPHWENLKEFSKQSPEWIENYKLTKEILDTREHIDSRADK